MSSKSEEKIYRDLQKYIDSQGKNQKLWDN